MKKFSNYILLITLFLSISSCVSRKKIIYFQNDSVDQSKVSNSYVTIFKPDDLLQITVSSTDIESAIPFNLPIANIALTTNSAAGQPTQQLYLVNGNGEIDFPLIGIIKIGGLNREEAIAKLKEEIVPDYLKDATINIRIANYKVTVLGDVRNPGSYTIPNERITILEAIGLAGDLNISAQRADILVERELDGKKIFYKVDLLSNETFTSPVYYLQQNDLVYVRPNKAKMQSASYNQNTGLFISIASVLISLITIVTR